MKDYFESHTAEQQLLRHDKPLHASAQAPHLKHIPAYLRDPSMVQGASETGTKPGRNAILPQRKRARSRGNVDPLKAITAGTGTSALGGVAEAQAPTAATTVVRGFVPAPKWGGDGLEELTELERKAEEAAKKRARREAKAAQKEAKRAGREAREAKGKAGSGRSKDGKGREDGSKSDARPKASKGAGGGSAIGLGVKPPAFKPKVNVRAGKRRRR